MDESNQMIITLDGPAGSGKSSAARWLAQRLGIEFLDTGAMYRAIVVACLDSGIDPGKDAAGAIDVARRTKLEFDWSHDPPRLMADGRDVTDRLRDPDVTAGASEIAVMGEVRQVLVEAQRRIGRDHPRLVTEGRDQGSVVFPGAQVKFYLDAIPPVRAQRRVKQLREAGKEADEQQILESILIRDQRDSTRRDGPLVCPDDAVRVETSDMTLAEVVDHLERQVRGIMAGDRRQRKSRNARRDD